MPTMSLIPPKPKNEVYRPGLTQLPPLTKGRRLVRRILHALIKTLVRLCFRLEIDGAENSPTSGPLLVVSNHLGGSDVLIGMAVASKPYDIFGKIELYDIPIVGKLMDAYGTIWVHRGQPDRKAIRAALNGLAEGRILAIAPEGRESTTGELEEGTGGAAYLALKSDVSILPIAVTGTEDWRVYANLKRFRRTSVTLTIGEPFKIRDLSDRRQSVDEGTDVIMLAIAKLLPESYRGVYRKRSGVYRETVAASTQNPGDRR